jgi:cell shape-determining protein MreD
MTWRRALGLLAVAYVALILHSALAVYVSWPLPDLGFLVALYAGLTCRFAGGAVAALRDAGPLAMLGLGAAMGYFSDLICGTPTGLRALGFALLLLLLRVLASHLLVRSPGAVMAVAATFVLLFRALISILLLLVDHGTETAAAGWRAALGQAIATGLLAPLVFHVLSRIDARLWRDPRASSGLRYGNARTLY